MYTTILHEDRVNHDPEVSRLLTAAVINRRFQNQLLSDPSAALRNGFNGEKFHFAPQVKNLILSIRAETLADFAAQLMIVKPEPLYPIALPTNMYDVATVSPGLD